MTKPHDLLNEFNKDEWREVVRKLGKDEEFERHWAKFQAAKARKAMQ